MPLRVGVRFVSAAIDSILAQTCSSLELLIVDDGSTDGSWPIVLDRSRADPRIVTLRAPSGGIAHALNAGIRAACGEFIARMDADDIAHPQRLEKQLAFLRAHPSCVAVGSGVELMDEDGLPLGVSRFPTSNEQIILALIEGAQALAHPTIVMRAAAVASAGGYRQAYFPSEDLDLWMRLADFGDLANVPELLLRYRRHPGAIGIQQARRQADVADWIVNEARRKRGLRQLDTTTSRIVPGHASDYHVACARSALTAGRYSAVLKHATRAMKRAPLSAGAMLCACLLPRPMVYAAVGSYRWLRAARKRLSTS